MLEPIYRLLDGLTLGLWLKYIAIMELSVRVRLQKNFASCVAFIQSLVIRARRAFSNAVTCPTFLVVECLVKDALQQRCGYFCLRDDSIVIVTHLFF